MATVLASGTSDVTAGYTAIFTGLPIAGTYFIRLLIDEPSLRFPRYYGDFLQIAVDLPSTGEFCQIYHQKIYLDVVELNIRRDFGAAIVTVPAFRWKYTGIEWELLSY